VEHLFFPEGVSERIGVTTKTLAHWRCAGSGPKYVKIGGRIMYRPEDVRDYVAARVINRTSETVA
jgi:predicted site-specific integrase-resolvase